MKKHLIWAAVFAAVAAVCAVLWIFANHGGQTAYIYLDGKLYKSVPLDTESTFRINTAAGYNDICIHNGEIWVSEADCPDKVCVKSGKLKSGGMPIVCLPHRLTIEIGQQSGTDAVSK